MIGDKEEIVNLLNYFFDPCNNENSRGNNNSINVNSIVSTNTDALDDYDEVKLAIIMSLEKFLKNPSCSYVRFPTSLSDKEQQLIMTACDKLSLKYRIYKHKNYKKQSGIIVYKRDIKDLFLDPISFPVTWNSRRLLSHFLSANPVTLKDQQDILQKTDKETASYRTTTGKLIGAVPQIPVVTTIFQHDLQFSSASSGPSFASSTISAVTTTSSTTTTTNTSSCSVNNEHRSSVCSEDDLLNTIRSTSTSSSAQSNSNNSYTNTCSLDDQTASFNFDKPNSHHAIWQMKQDVIKALKETQFLVVFGAAGVGKTTQIAEMIIEDCSKSGEPCRIICSQPYGLCAQANAHFISHSRRESIGQTVGYQIRLESKVSPKTFVTFCTNEVLLRTLYGDRCFLTSTTHIIIDELQQRTQHADLLLSFLHSKLQHVFSNTGVYTPLKVLLIVSTPILPSDIATTSLYKPSSYYMNHFSTTTTTCSGSSVSTTNNSSSTGTGISRVSTQSSKLSSSNSAELFCTSLPVKYAELVDELRKYFNFSTTLYARKPSQHIDEIFLEEILQMINCTMPITNDQPVTRSDIQSQKLMVDRWFTDYWLLKQKDIISGVNLNSSNNSKNNLGLFEIFCRCYVNNSQLNKTHHNNNNSNMHNIHTGTINLAAAANVTIDNLTHHYQHQQQHKQQFASNKHKTMDFKVIYDDLLFLIFSQSDIGDYIDDTDTSNFPYPPDPSSGPMAATPGNESKQYPSSSSSSSWNDILFTNTRNTGSSMNTTNTNLGSQNCFKLMFHFISNDFVSINHRHRTSGMTALMICAFRGFKHAVKQLLELSADPLETLPITSWFSASYQSYQIHLFTGESRVMTLLNTISQYGSMNESFGNLSSNSAATSNMPPPSLSMSHHFQLMSHELAIMSQNFELADLIIGRIITKLEFVDIPKLQKSFYTRPNFASVPPSIHVIDEMKSGTTNNSSSSNNFTDSQLLQITNCQNLIKNTQLLFKIIMKLLKILIHKTDNGTILIFLPEYDYLVQFKNLIMSSADSFFPKTFKFNVFLLHSKMMLEDLNILLNQNEKYTRKIILSTDIGESCINIPDVAFVIDSGLETKYMYDNVLKTHAYKISYISKYQAALRASRATNQSNRICFHIYSRGLFESMAESIAPRLLISTLNELLLHAKLLIPQTELKLDQFLDTMLDKPYKNAAESSVIMLKSLQAIDDQGDISELGYHLYDLPVDPKYGKMVLYGVLLKCLDPILTISCILSSISPFQQANSPKMFQEISEIKRKFASNTSSDHMVFLRAFQFWQKARSEGCENSFCEKNHMSSSVFESITGTRSQLLGQLRASGFVKSRGIGDIRDLNINSENWAVVKAAIVAGTCSSDFMHFNHQHEIMITGKSSKVRIHDLSILNHLNNPSSTASTTSNQNQSYSHTNSIGSNTNNLSTNLYMFNQSLSIPTLHVAHTQTSNSNNDSPRLSPIRKQQDNETTNYSLHSILTNEIEYLKYVTMVTPITVVLMNSTVNLNNPMNLNDAGNAMPSNTFGSSNCHGYGTSEDHDTSLSSSQEEELGEYCVSGRSKKRAQPREGNASLCFSVADEELAVSVTRLRQKWCAYVARKLRNPTKQVSLQDELLLRVLVTVLTNEEQAYGLKQPVGVGARPRPMVPEHCNHLQLDPTDQPPPPIPSVPPVSRITNMPYRCPSTITNSNSNCCCPLDTSCFSMNYSIPSSTPSITTTKTIPTDSGIPSEIETHFHHHHHHQQQYHQHQTIPDIDSSKIAKHPNFDPYTYPDRRKPENSNIEATEKTCESSTSDSSPNKTGKSENYFFAVKLKNEDEMRYISETQVYHVSILFKCQIENLLASGYRIYLIFINEITYGIMGLARVLYVDLPISVIQPQNESSGRTSNLLYSIKLDISIDYKEESVSIEMMKNVIESLRHTNYSDSASDTVKTVLRMTPYDTNQYTSPDHVSSSFPYPRCSITPKSGMLQSSPQLNPPVYCSAETPVHQPIFYTDQSHLNIHTTHPHFHK